NIHPILIASYLHSELVKIHPFIDGNGRTSRLLMNLYLLAHGYTIANIKGDNESKLVYYKALETSHTQNNTEAFNEVVANEVVHSLERYLSIIER
ncbi:MAG: Fic family protein, partial [Chitinophagaceae bacterium]